MPKSSTVGIDGQLLVDKRFYDHDYIPNPFAELCADILRQCVVDAKWLIALLTRQKIYRSAKMNDRMLKLYRANDPIEFLLNERNYCYDTLYAERQFDSEPLIEWAENFSASTDYVRRIKQWRGVYAQWLALAMSERTHNRLEIAERGFRLLPRNGTRRGRQASG